MLHISARDIYSTTIEFLKVDNIPFAVPIPVGIDEMSAKPEGYSSFAHYEASCHWVLNFWGRG